MRLLLPYFLIIGQLRATDVLPWLADKTEDISFDANEPVNLFNGDPIWSAVARAGFERTPSPDSKYTIRKEHWRLNPSANIGGLISDLTGTVLPVGISVDVERGVSFYRRAERALIPSVLKMPLSPLNNIPSSGDDLAQKIPPGTTVHIPARTRVSIGKGYSTPIISNALAEVGYTAAKAAAQTVDITSILGVSASFTVQAKYDLLITRKNDDPNIAQVQLIASKDDSLQAGITAGIQGVLENPNIKGLERKAYKRVRSKVMGKLFGQPLNVDFAQQGNSVQCIFDYSYDLNNKVARDALTKAINGLKPFVDLKVMKNVSARGPSSVLADIFSPAFEDSHRLATDQNSGVSKKNVVSSERSYTENGFQFGINAIGRVKSSAGQSNTLSHTEKGPQLALQETNRSEIGGPFGIGRETKNETLTTHVGFDPEGRLMDGYQETVYQMDFVDKKFDPESIHEVIKTLRAKLGPDALPYVDGPPETQNELSNFLRYLLNNAGSDNNQLNKGAISVQFKLSPKYLFLARSRLKESALYYGHSTQAQQHAFISATIAKKVINLAARMGIEGIITIGEGCVKALSDRLAMFLLFKNLNPPYFDVGLERYQKKLPWICGETYDNLALPTIVEFLNDVPTDPSLGPRYSTYAHVTGRTKATKKVPSKDLAFEFGQRSAIYTPLQDNIAEVLALQGQSLDPFAGLANTRIPQTITEPVANPMTTPLAAPSSFPH